MQRGNRFKGLRVADLIFVNDWSPNCQLGHPGGEIGFTMKILKDAIWALSHMFKVLLNLISRLFAPNMQIVASKWARG